jgi:hypothetical protein
MVGEAMLISDKTGELGFKKEGKKVNMLSVLSKCEGI